MDSLKNQRVGIFVDVQNLYYSAKNLYGAKVNFGEVLKAALDNRQLIRAMAYVIKAQNPDEQKFFEALDKQGFEVKTKDLQVFFGGNKKGDWDIGIAMDAIRLSPKVDSIVLVTGDGDFIPLVEYLKNHGQFVEIVAFAESASSQLVHQADRFIDLSGNRRKYLIARRFTDRTRQSAR
ncbi:MAG: NYN domain-containing protein [Patescibacteria group bacterium]|nr:NYN domain-containing protein [Patescibacteria group bacterium]MDD5715587.1 NYN domain-containing protein [Patescibacteria group bacterium]